MALISLWADCTKGKRSILLETLSGDTLRMAEPSYRVVGVQATVVGAHHLSAPISLAVGEAGTISGGMVDNNGTKGTCIALTNTKTKLVRIARAVAGHFLLLDGSVLVLFVGNEPKGHMDCIAFWLTTMVLRIQR
jgi:hypothetical protein